jgi:hypothetical protein
MKHEALKPTNRRSTDPSNRLLYIDTCTSRDIRRYAVEVRWFILQHQIRNTPAVEIWEVKKDAWCLGNDLAIEEVQGMIHSHQTNKPPNLVLVIYHRSSLDHIAPVLWTEANYIRAWSIIESRCLAISQVWRAKLYNKCLLFILKKISFSYSSSQHLLLGHTDAYAFMSSFVPVWEPNSHLSYPFSPPYHQH